jgi:hypothetical protein
MNGEDYRRAIERLEMKRGEAADLFGVDVRTSLRWIRGQLPVPRVVAALIYMMIHFKVSHEFVAALMKRRR